MFVVYCSSSFPDHEASPSCSFSTCLPKQTPPVQSHLFAPFSRFTFQTPLGWVIRFLCKMVCSVKNFWVGNMARRDNYFIFSKHLLQNLAGFSKLCISKLEYSFGTKGRILWCFLPALVSWHILEFTAMDLLLEPLPSLKSSWSSFPSKPEGKLLYCF